MSDYSPGPKAFFFLTALLWLHPFAHSQDTKFNFEHYSLDQGMSGGSIRCIYQDHTGYLWFGTFEGIDRYDGYSFTSYKHDPEDSSSLVNAFVNTFFEDRLGYFWVGTESGLEKLDRVTGKFAHYVPNPPGPGNEWINAVLSIHEDKDGILWVGTRKGLSILDRSTGQFTSFSDERNDPDGTGGNSIRPIHADRAGSLWTATGRGLSRFDKKTVTFLHYLHEFMARDRFCDWIFSIYEDASGVFWLGGDAGLISFDQRTETFTQYRHNPKNPQSISSNEVTSISEDQAGNLWVGTRDHGLNVFDKKTKSFARIVRNESDPGSVSSNGIMSLYCERSGTIWVGTVNKGVNKLNRAKPPFTSYPYDDQATNTVSPQVFADNAGKIWVHPSNEWKKFDPRTETFLRQPLDKDMRPLLEDRAGNLWIGKHSGGLYKRGHSGSMTSVHDSSDLGFHRVVTCLIETRDGRLWTGTDYGNLFEVDPAAMSAKWVQWVGSQINSIYEESSGVLWLGTWSSGLFSYDPKKQRTVQYRYDPEIPASLNANFVGTVYEDKAGTLWVGAQRGLDRFDRVLGTFTHFTTKDGLPSDGVGKILEDDHGNLWLGTRKGISKFDPRTARFRNYDVSYGLADNAIRIQSGCKTPNGEMYFGGKGLTRFHPDNIRDNPYVPPIVVTRFLLFEKPAPFDKEVKVSYRENFLSFEFAALSYVNSERNRYRYKMEGLDEDWVYSGTRRYAAYPHLDPGEYVFKVRGTNNDGVWNEEGASIVVVVTPPFWDTWWFRAIVFVAILVSVGGGIRYVEMKKIKRKIERLEHERALERERARISEDMHDEVGASLTEIAILSELARKELGNDSDIADAHIRRIADRSREVVDSMGEIIWTINPKNDHLNDLVAYLRHYTTVFLKSTTIRSRFESPESVPDFSLSAEVRRHIFLVVKEALHNVVKHSKATETTVRVSFGDGMMGVSVEDNGTGFPFEQIPRFGNGVLSMQKRIESIGGTFVMDSDQGAGTKVCISIPFAVPLS